MFACLSLVFLELNMMHLFFVRDDTEAFIIIMRNNSSVVESLITQLHSNFALKNLNSLNYFFVKKSIVSGQVCLDFKDRYMPMSTCKGLSKTNGGAMSTNEL